MTSDEKPWFSEVELPASGLTLRAKHMFEYTTEQNVYDVELFVNQDGSCYAIGVPREGGKVIIYGTSVVPSTRMALQMLVDKIERGGM